MHYPFIKDTMSVKINDSGVTIEIILPCFSFHAKSLQILVLI